MALTQPQLAELKRFTFFVSRRLEDRRERFRLHMGYFETLQDAEDWLGIVREIYPGAWAGETPGKKLRERAAGSPAAPLARPAAPPSPPPIARNTAPPASVRAPVPAPVQIPAPAPAVAALPPLGLVPTLQAAPSPAAPAPVSSRAQQLSRAHAARTQARTPPKPAAAKPPAAKPPVAKPAPAKPVVAKPAAPAASATPARTPSRPNSNVREVLARLDDTGHTRQMPAPVLPRAAPGRPDPLSDSQVLRILEERRADGGRTESSDTGISLLRPDDTGTRRALKDAVAQNQPVAFAVQLNWSVQPIDLRAVPPLAIFSAYTLYTVEGSREGRHWYGLRLGFFSDAISAKQVAYYVRSEFTSVAVVPVSPQERDRASAAQHGGALERKTVLVQDRLPAATSEFKLFDATTEARMLAAEKAATPPPAPLPSAALEATARGPTPKRGAKRQPGKVGAREKRSPKTLEETLEILGAGDLEIDNGRGELLNDTGVRHLKMSVQKETPFTKLLDKLTDRLNRG